MKAALPRDYVAQVEADAYLKFGLVTECGLNGDGTVHCIHRAGEAREGLVSDMLDPARVLLDQRPQTAAALRTTLSLPVDSRSLRTALVRSRVPLQSRWPQVCALSAGPALLRAYGRCVEPYGDSRRSG